MQNGILQKVRFIFNGKLFNNFFDIYIDVFDMESITN